MPNLKMHYVNREEMDKLLQENPPPICPTAPKRMHWFGNPNELLIDLDTIAQRNKFEHRITKFNPLLLREFSLVPSTTRNHYHALVTCSCDLEQADLVHFCKWLGSDIRRCNADRQRYQAGIDNFQLLIRYTRPRFWRKPDFVCHCPAYFKNVKTGKIEKLRSCRCFRLNYSRFWVFGLRTEARRQKWAKILNVKLRGKP